MGRAGSPGPGGCPGARGAGEGAVGSGDAHPARFSHSVTCSASTGGLSESPSHTVDPGLMGTPPERDREKEELVPFVYNNEYYYITVLAKSK